MPETSRAAETAYAVEATDLALAHGTFVALSKSNCHVPAGQVTAVIGPNGSGKSTFLDSVTGLLEPVGGTLTVLGQRPVDARPRVSYVLQNVEAPVDLPLTVRETVAMGRYASLGWFRRLRAADRDAIDAALERMRITDLAHRHLHELSGGQRHRVLVAQGLAQEHDVLILDEPLAGLDIVSAEVIDGIVHDTGDSRTGDRRTVIHTTHDLSEAAAADHVILMGGRVVAEGPPDEVLLEEHLVEAFGTRGLHPPID